MRSLAVLALLSAPLVAAAGPVPADAPFTLVFPWAVGTDDQPVAVAADGLTGAVTLPDGFTVPGWLSPTALQTESVKVTVSDPDLGGKVFVSLPPFATWTADTLGTLPGRLPDEFDLTKPAVEAYFDVNGNTLAVLRNGSATVEPNPVPVDPLPQEPVPTPTDPVPSLPPSTPEPTSPSPAPVDTPEPATLVLAAVGLAGVAARRRMRRK